jgi:hypothetical protein
MIRRSRGAQRTTGSRLDHRTGRLGRRRSKRHKEPAFCVRLRRSPAGTEQRLLGCWSVPPATGSDVHSATQGRRLRIAFPSAHDLVHLGGDATRRPSLSLPKDVAYCGGDLRPVIWIARQPACSFLEGSALFFSFQGLQRCANHLISGRGVLASSCAQRLVGAPPYSYRGRVGHGISLHLVYSSRAKVSGAWRDRILTRPPHRDGPAMSRGAPREFQTPDAGRRMYAADQRATRA